MGFSPESATLIDFRPVDFVTFVCFSCVDSSVVSPPFLPFVEGLTDFLRLVDPDAICFLGVGLFLGEVAINASKSLLLSPEGTYVLNVRKECRSELENRNDPYQRKTENP